MKVKSIKIGAIVCLILFLGSLFGCSKPIFRSDKLTLPKQEISVTSLMKIDGYYYLLDNNKFISKIYFFYENSILMHDGFPPNSNFSDIETKLNDPIYINTLNDSKLNWGRWNLNGKEINYEIWTSRDGPYPIYMFSGNLINDSILNFTKSFRSKNLKNEKAINETYYFKKFSPKPASSNLFVN